MTPPKSEYVLVPDDRVLGEMIYRAMYEHQGGMWSANETRDVWYDMGKRLRAMLAASPTITSWHRIDDPVNPAPKDGTLIEAWHHIWKCWLPLKYRTGVVDGCEWVEATGAVAWPSDAFTHWRLASLPPAPDEGGE